MDAKRTAGEDSAAQVPETAVGRTKRPPAWTVAKLIELLDEAIDAAGAQLARSAGLWADSPSGPPAAQQQARQSNPRRRPVRRGARDSWPSTPDSVVEGALAERELELP